MTVEEVATLAMRLGWDYDALMSMTLAERRLWLAASERAARVARPRGAGVAPAKVPDASVPASPAGAAPGWQPPPAAAPVGPGLAPIRQTTEEERRARLLELLREEVERYRRR